MKYVVTGITFWMFFGSSTAIFHCVEHLSKTIVDKVLSKLDEHKSQIFTGYLTNSINADLTPLTIRDPPPCGTYLGSHQAEDKFAKTAVQLYQYDPTLTPHLILSITSVRVSTECKTRWFGRNEKTIESEAVSTFEKLPQDEWEVYATRIPGLLHSMSAGEEKMEVLNQEIYECPKLFNPGKKSTYVLRVQVKKAYWSPTGFLVAPWFLKNCRFTSDLQPCNASAHTKIYWDSSTRTGPPLLPTVTMGGLLELSDHSLSNGLCQGARRFTNIKNSFQLSFRVPDIGGWEPEVYINGIPVFLSDEGVYFSFLSHDGELILKSICPSWKYDKPNRRSRQVIQPPRSSSEVPLDLQTMTLEEEVAWIRARTEGHLSGLYNRTVREIMLVHYNECQLRKSVLELAISLSPLDPRPYLSSVLGHRFFEVVQRGKKRYYKTALPVSEISLDLHSAKGQNIPVNFTVSGRRESGYFVCGLGYIKSSPLEESVTTDHCYLYLHDIGGIDLCSGETTPSSYEGVMNTDWNPKIEVPFLRLSDMEYGNELEENSYSFIGPRDFISSMGHSLVHPDSNFPSLSDYTLLIDHFILVLPWLILFLIAWKIVACVCQSEGTTSVKSRVF